METDPKLEGADLQLRAARFDYRQLSQQLIHRRLHFDSVKQYQFAEECFHAAEKTIGVRSKRGHLDDVELNRVWASAYQARIAVLNQLAWLSKTLKLDPSLTGADAIRWISGMPHQQVFAAPGKRGFGTLDGFLLLAGAVTLGLIFFH